MVWDSHVIPVAGGGSGGPVGGSGLHCGVVQFGDETATACSELLNEDTSMTLPLKLEQPNTMLVTDAGFATSITLAVEKSLFQIVTKLFSLEPCGRDANANALMADALIAFRTTVVRFR
jgi:hypothetical protein